MQLLVYYIYMYRILQIVCCIFAVACAAVTIFIFAYFNLWGLMPLGGVAVFGALMVTFKQLDAKKQLKKNPPKPEGDFITGKADRE